ncbi:DNA primase [Symmachiella dynata]|uniref:DNA primase n=1 Tax=Symmachiella dynata TaxID=2527995 RepID=A0A517ZHE6_9PLAN|nr:DNA primase [Symmachiella dynata]QDU41872.1 DNA primase [Symmachiella dynata]
MPRQSSEEFKELVRSRTDIVSLIGEGVSLESRRGGHEFVGLCPFHDDRNPSLRVYPERQSFKCWSCNTGGDCFEFVMQSERVEFREAIELLATRANIEMPRTHQRGSQSQDGTSKSQLFEVVAWAEQQFHECLLNSPQAATARDYLNSRGFTADVIAAYRLGYHPNDWEWLIQRARGKFGLDVLTAAKLAAQRDGGRGYYDYFVDRVMFPIRDMQRRPVAFGGRILPGETRENAPKYFNSLESIIFTKSRLLYGFDHARDAIRKTDTVVVVEGYTDCITTHQHGQMNVVGTLGTALTETHVTNLKRFARKVVLVYDGDDAGQNAAERALTKFLAQEVDLRIMTLPAGMDPADFLATHGAAAFAKDIEQAPEAWQHKFRRAVARYGVDSIDAKDRVLDEMLEVLATVPHTGGADAGKWRNREDLILGSLVQRLGLKEHAVRQRLSDIRRRAADRQRNHDGPEAMQHDGPAYDSVSLPRKSLSRRDVYLEQELLQIVLAHPAVVGRLREDFACEELQDPQLRKLLACCYGLMDAGEELTFLRVMAELEDSALKGIAVSLDEEARRKGIGADLLEQTLACLRERHTTDAVEMSGQIREQVQQSGGGLNDETAAMLRRLSEYNKKRAVKNKLA